MLSNLRSAASNGDKGGLQLDTIDIISLGAGVQSSTLLLKADRGEFKIDGEVVIPKYAIMSDTGNEPDKVYEWLSFLQSQVKNIEIVLTDNGDIVRDTLKGIENHERFSSVPFFVVNDIPIYEQVLKGHKKVVSEEFGEIDEPIYEDGELIEVKKKRGILWRQCTRDYKIYPVRREIRKLLGYQPREKVREHVRLWMGISTDEIQRVKPSQVKFIENIYPLIDEDMSRLDCLRWFQDNDLPLPPKSSCIICPYHSDEHWLDIKRNDPKAWDMAVNFDKQIRHMPSVNGAVYLHRSCVPLDEVALKDNQESFDLFGNECEGMCGL